MPRALTTEMLASIELAAGVDVVHFLRFAFEGGDVRVCTATDDLDWAGVTWQGVGGAIRSSGLGESAESGDNGPEITISAVNVGVAQKLLSELRIGRAAEIFLAHLDPATGQVVPDPIDSFIGEMSGRFELMFTRDADPSGVGGTAVIKGRLVRSKSKNRRPGIQMNPDSHQRYFPGDLGMEYVQFLATTTIRWGRDAFNLIERGTGKYDDGFG